MQCQMMRYVNDYVIGVTKTTEGNECLKMCLRS